MLVVGVCVLLCVCGLFVIVCGLLFVVLLIACCLSLVMCSLLFAA